MARSTLVAMAARQILSIITIPTTTHTPGCPGSQIQTAMGQVLSLILYHIADDPLIPWDLPNAASVLQTYLSELDDKVEESDFPDLDLSPLATAIEDFTEQANHIATIANHATTLNDLALLDVVNKKYRDFARGFASVGGLPGRETFKNVVSAPGIDNGYGADVFPAVTDSVSAGNERAAVEWVQKSAKAVARAAEILKIR